MKLNQKALADVEIGFPVIAEGAYHMRFDKPEMKPNKKGDGFNLVLKIKILDNPVNLYKDGKQIENKGRLSLVRRISMVPTPDYDPDEKMKEIAVAIGIPPENDLTLEDIEGKLCIVKVSYRGEHQDEAGKKYPPSNEIDRFTPVPPEDAFTPPPF